MTAHPVTPLLISAVTTESPFVQLSSLKHLELKVDTCNRVNEKLFSGLDKLNYLELTNHGGCIIDFSPLVSLTYLSYEGVYPADIQICIQPLNSLNSPLRTLELRFVFFLIVRFNSTTFKSLPKWKESLQELKIRVYYEETDIEIEGSPFKWFSQLHLFCICGDSTGGSTVSWHSPEKTFLGLSNLQEIHLNYLNINDNIAYDVLSTFVMYNYSLEVLDLAHNGIQLLHIESSILGKIYSMSTLETIDISNNIYQFQSVTLYLEDFCKYNSNLSTLNVNNYG